MPRLDHGSDSMETSLFQLNLAKSAGIKTIVATSHFYPHRHSAVAFIEARKIAYEALCDEWKDDALKIVPAAEILLCERLDTLPELSELAVRNTKNLLIELPMNGFSSRHIDAVSGMLDKGYKVILAHPERFARTDIESLIALGAKLQLNAAALSSLFIKSHVKEWISRNLVTALGSDIHMLDKNAYKRFLKAAERLESMDANINQKINSIFE